MAIKVKTSQPQLFVDELRKRIKLNMIDGWLCDSDGDFTYNVERWGFLAWFRPYLKEPDFLIFGIIGRDGYNITIEEYSKYHVSFVELLIKNFVGSISNIEVTMPLISVYDSFDVEI